MHFMYGTTLTQSPTRMQSSLCNAVSAHACSLSSSACVYDTMYVHRLCRFLTRSSIRMHMPKSVAAHWVNTCRATVCEWMRLQINREREWHWKHMYRAHQYTFVRTYTLAYELSKRANQRTRQRSTQMLHVCNIIRELQLSWIVSMSMSLSLCVCAYSNGLLSCLRVYACDHIGNARVYKISSTRLNANS